MNKTLDDILKESWINNHSLKTEDDYYIWKYSHLSEYLAIKQAMITVQEVALNNAVNRVDFDNGEALILEQITDPSNILK